MAIYLKRNITATKLSVLHNGAWKFGLPTNKVRLSEGISYYKIDYIFGVLDSQEQNPMNVLQIGQPFDYLVSDTLETYSVMSKKKYDVLFPSPIQYHTTPPPLSSEALKDPNFLTKVVEGQTSPQYNSTQATPSTTGTSTY
jgi:hypothetical protein